MKKYLLMLTALAVVGLNSCSNNDDFDNLNNEPVVLNEFCYGPNETDFFAVSQAFNGLPQPVGPNVFTTSVQVVDQNFTNNQGALDGAGSLVSFNFTGNEDVVLQQGRYSIGSAQGVVGNVFVSYSLDYDTANQLNDSVIIASGNVWVVAYRSGFVIEVNGLDQNGVAFHGNYVGNLTEL